MKLNIIILLYCLCGSSFYALANQNQIDSLVKALENLQDGKEKYETAWAITELYYCGEKAEAYYEIAKNQAYLLNNDTLIASIFLKKGWLTYCNNQLDSSQFYIDKTIEKYKVLQDNRGIAIAYNFYGIILSDFEKFDLSSKMYQKAIQYAQKVEGKRGTRLRAAIYNNWGSLLIKAKRAKLAQATLKKALPCLDTLNDRLEFGRIYYNLGRAYQMDQQYNIALKYFLQSHERRLVEVNLAARGEPLCNIGETMIEMLVAPLDTAQFSSIYTTLKMNNIPEILDSTMYLAKASESINLQERVLLVRIKYYKYKGDYKSALADMTTYNSIREEYLLSEENLEGLQSLQDKLKQQQLENEVLKTNIKQKQTTNQRNILALGLSALVLLSLFGYLLLQQRVKARQAKLNLAVQKNEILKNRQQIIAVNAMLEGQDQERARIAKDLHDGLGTMLTTVRRSVATNNEASLLLEEAYSEVRRIAHNMMPQSLKQLGLKEALADLSTKVDRGNDFEVTFQTFGKEQRLNENKEIMLYRSIQEAFTNIQKHANAQEVILQITYGDEWLNILLEDDGKGFDKNQLNYKNGLGLHSIESRVEYINGECLIESQEGAGTSISINIPL